MTGLAAGVNFWFQARLVDKLGNTGPWTNWVQGTSSEDASEVLDYLKGKITETELGQDLLGPVEDAGKLKDMWSVKVGKTVDGKLYTAGIGVGVENTPEGMQSQVLILADRFAVLNTADGQGSAVSVPFAIENNQVFINDAFIKDASITNAKIGEYISSNNYIPGMTGWIIRKDGSADFQNVTVRGDIYANYGVLNNVTINENCTVKGTVYAENIVGDVVSVGAWGRILNSGVNDSKHRYFTGGLPYASVLIVSNPGLYTGNKPGSGGSVYIKVNGVDIFRASGSSGTRYDSAIVVDVPANGTVDMEFGITGAESGQFWGNDGPMAVMVFRKGNNRFHD